MPTEIIVPTLELDHDYQTYGDRQPGVVVSARVRNSQARRPFQLEIFATGTSSVRELTIEDVRAIKDWCDKALSAAEWAIYLDEVA